MQNVMTRNKSNLVDIAESFAEDVNNKSSMEEKKLKGQYFTPSSIAKYMASMVILEKKQIKVLDPGSGLGILTCALCDRISNEKPSVTKLTVDLYESDQKLIPHLMKIMEL